MESVTDIILNPVFLGVVAVLGAVGTWVVPFILREDKDSNSKKCEFTNKTKTDHVKTVATAVTFAPPIHDIGKSISKSISTPKVETIDATSEMLSQASQIAGTVASASYVAEIPSGDSESSIDLLANIAKETVV